MQIALKDHFAARSEWGTGTQWRGGHSSYACVCRTNNYCCFLASDRLLAAPIAWAACSQLITCAGSGHVQITIIIARA